MRGNLETNGITKNTKNSLIRKQWKNTGLTRRCPECNKSIQYSSWHSFRIGVLKNSICLSCSHKKENLSVETRRRLSESHSGVNHPMWGKKQLLSSKTKNSISQSGVNSHCYGKTQSEEAKRKHRIAMLKRKELLKIPITEDKGAKQFFENLNERGFDFRPTRFMELGYEADGYDKNKHIWYEYDTPYHNTLHQQRKDLVRQSNIIQYFRDINNPLNKFVRIKVNENGDITDTITII